MLKDKKILLGITGGIAAYKAAILVRLFKKHGADVKVVLTPSALSFVTPLTMATLSENPVWSDFVSNEDSGEWTNHVALGKWADVMVIAPLSANTMSKMATGACDNFFMAVYMSTDCPVVVAPAMDLDMAAHATTLANIEVLRARNHIVLPFGDGQLASGLTGKGRMQEPDAIFKATCELLLPESKLRNKRLLVTAGPTFESIDPVRFIGNHSSGKMGYAIAHAAGKRGANVVLISGPTALHSEPWIKRANVMSAAEMHQAVIKEFEHTDVLIMAAAVADFRPANVANEKIKKTTADVQSIALEPTVDILSACGKMKESRILVGFALETENELENAKNKVKNKNLDMLVLNSLRDKGAGFGTDTNKVTFVYRDRVVPHELKTKDNVANDILDAIENLL